MPNEVDPNRRSFIDYDPGHTPVHNPNDAGHTPVSNDPADPGFFPGPDHQPPRYQTFNGRFIQQDLEKATRNGVFSNGEVEVLKGRIGNLRTKEELADAYALLSDSISTSMIRAGDRAELGQALWAAAQRVEGGMEVIPIAVTEAVGEDIFGMGALPLGEVAERVWFATQNETISDYETGRLVEALGDMEDRWDLYGAQAALSYAVNGNVINSENRGKLAAAYQGAAARLGDPVLVTEAVGEDVFGMGGMNLSMDIIEKSVRNGAFDPIEVKSLVKEIGNIERPEMLANVYMALSKSIGDPDRGAKLIRPKDRTRLARAIFDANEKFDNQALPLRATRALGEDVFGMGHRPQTSMHKSAMTAIQDSVVSRRNVQKMVAALDDVDDEHALAGALSVARTAVSLNMVSREDRRTLADAFMQKANDLDTGYAVTRALGEDIFGTGASMI